MTEKWRLFALAGLATTVLFVGNLSPVVNAACVLLLGAGTVWACFAGPRGQGTEPRTAWLLLGSAALAFLIGVLLRPVVADADGLRPLLADCATVPGYMMLCAFLYVMLRQRQSLERHAVLDGLIVCVAGALVVILLLAAPAAAITDRPAPESVLAGLYPLFDVVVLLLVINLTFTATTWPASLVTLLSAMVSLLAGDIAYAVIGISGRTYASPLFDVPFLVAYGLIGVTALHPSVTRLGQAARPPVPAWSGGRIALLAPALTGPFVLLLVLPDVSREQRTTIAVAGAVSVVLLLVRAVTAVQAQVAAQVRAEHQAMHDALTGLPNRYMITEEVARMLGRPARVAEALMRDADTGRSMIFDAAMHDQVRERIELEVALRRALGEGQLSVAYQPIVDLVPGVPAGAEALVRWVHPERGPIPPATFIPIAEEAGLIGALGDRVRQEALRQLGSWRTDGTVDDNFYLSINVSGRQLTDPRLPLVVSSEMLQYGIPARCVALEMTESVLVDSSGVPGRVLFELRELGCQVLIDDFGTGFSALGNLRRFPVTGIKIDRSFVTGLGLSPEDDAIVRAVVAMSHALDLTVIAEGVETRLQRDALAAVGVTRGQGWLWGPAVPPAEFARHWHAGGAVALAGRHRRG
ncbi:GGDEF domain-containing protein [Actinoplanes sp. LDG1-06]|uniref:GGDEF domain-containing protein n=1 Tax=Paractinoplanes ovalisporus TaxID=2810368 RepID=A0ABS2ANU0_9ACTN|nr:EAL domain-containing protein [Actinoplanes ovalisporus]MBM2621438.1 GGDEF domain-containing protein [Actinoplanes ovalisporus]